MFEAWITSPALQKIIKEYCIGKICSALECGPFIGNILGFDLIVFNNRIEFAMEQCLPLYEISDWKSDVLLEEMMTLHSYKIVHLDINPTNVMYSRKYEKLVFIDFGFSEVIKEDVGFKTETDFRGTIEYISK